jgi:regulatory protein
MEKSLMARAVDLLSRREYSRRELAQRLRPYAETPEALETVLEQLASNSWQSDQRFAEQYMQAKGAKYGSMRLRHAMREKGIDNESIQAALSDSDDLSTARAVWQRKFGELPATQQEKAKQMRFLASRGFPAEIIRQVLKGDFDDFE